MSRLATLLAALVLASAQAISYTVQVVAVSDQESALRTQRVLLDDAFPAYVVRASTTQGDIFRVRVGAFGNRPAALVYAEALPQVSGSSALPALAEGIPPGVMPLQPRLLTQSSDPFEVLSWGDGVVALRSQPDAERPASYRVFREGQELAFEAWRAGVGEQGLLRLRNLPLWPSSWEEDSSESREEFRAARLAALAARLDVAPAVLEAAQQRPTYGPPFLLVLESVGWTEGAEGNVVGVAAGDEDVREHGPDELLHGAAAMPAVGVPDYRASRDSEPVADSFSGEGWNVSANGRFFLLASGEGRGWRAGLGSPLWSDGRYLLTRDGGRFLFYEFVPR